VNCNQQLCIELWSVINFHREIEPANSLQYFYLTTAFRPALVSNPASCALNSGDFHGRKAAVVALTSFYCRGQEWVDLFLHFPVRLHGVVLNMHHGEWEVPCKTLNRTADNTSQRFRLNDARIKICVIDSASQPIFVRTMYHQGNSIYITLFQTCRERERELESIKPSAFSSEGLKQMRILL
jgi:hypothetical protein